MALYQIADAYNGKKEAEKAIGLYGDVVEKWPGSEQAIWSCMKMVQHHLKNKDKNAADAVREKFLALPAEHVLYPAGVRELAYAYERTGLGEEACTLNKYNVEHFLSNLTVTYKPLGGELVSGTNTVKVDIDDMVDNHMVQLVKTFGI